MRSAEQGLRVRPSLKFQWFTAIDAFEVEQGKRGVGLEKGGNGRPKIKGWDLEVVPVVVATQ